jgi:hypothetical protein
MNTGVWAPDGGSLFRARRGVQGILVDRTPNDCFELEDHDNTPEQVAHKNI